MEYYIQIQRIITNALQLHLPPPDFMGLHPLPPNGVARPPYVLPDFDPQPSLSRQGSTPGPLPPQNWIVGFLSDLVRVAYTLPGVC